MRVVHLDEQLLEYRTFSMKANTGQSFGAHMDFFFN